MAIRITDAFKPGYNRINLDLIRKSGPPESTRKVGSPVLNQAMADVLGMKSVASTPPSGAGYPWTEFSMPEAYAWKAVRYFSNINKYIAVGLNGRMAYSTDGLTWTVITVGTAHRYDVVQGSNGRLVCLAGQYGYTKTLSHSMDGVNWTEQSLGGYNGVGFCGAMLFDGTRFIALAYSENYWVQSVDGLTWTSGAFVNGVSVACLAYGNGMYVAGCYNSGAGTKYFTSPDGATWTPHTQAGFNYFEGILFDAGQFVAAYEKGIFTSPDGLTWTQQSLPSVPYQLWGITKGGGLYVVVSFNDNKCFTSPDAVTWTARAMPGGIKYWTGVAWGPAGAGQSRYVAVCDNAAMLPAYAP